MNMREKVTDWMRRQGMSQRELARVAGIHEAMISKFLNGTRKLGLRPTLRLAKAMGITVEELVK